ncbi:MAG: hydroxypyruvate isomerase [Gemmataceae bacterium]|nr:hydroxypyruvate isomerase [Gemmataceae bacterium]
MAREYTRRQALTASAATLPSLAFAQPPQGKGRIRHSACSWCFMSQGEKWTLDKLCQEAKGAGCVSIELLRPEQFATVKKQGLEIAIASNGMPGGFKRGFNNPAHRDELIQKTGETMQACSQAGVPSVIGFVGFKFTEPDNPKSAVISLEDAEKHCLASLKQAAALAEKWKVTLCIEHLNTRDASHPMKGHPGYQGDDLDWLARVVRKVGSPRVKILFDIYHVQIMHGDVMRRLQECKEILGHIHTAGNPGRNELDETQEIHYPAVMKQLLELGYKGFVGHEFIPTRNPREGLRQAVAVCDV